MCAMAQKIARQMTRQMTMCSSDRPTDQHRPPDPSAHHQKTTTTTTTNKKTTTTNNTNEWPGNLQCAVCGNNENSSEIAGF